MASRLVIPVLVVMMLVTGVCNTLLTKYQDNQCIRDCDNPDPEKRQFFEQPVLQTAQMFIGEMGSWIVVSSFWLYRRYTTSRAASQNDGYRPVDTTAQIDSEDDDVHSIEPRSPSNPATKALMRNTENRLPLRGWKVSLLALPAICDICGTTLMNVGLLFVAPSIYQMTRGALVLFVGLFSVIFLKKRLFLVHWFALVTVVLGVAVVGLAGALYKEDPFTPTAMFLSIRDTTTHFIRDTRTPEALLTLLGVCLIAGAQIFTATQFVLEEFILEKYALEPLRVVGWEGVFGFFVTVVGMIVLHLAIGRTQAGRYGYFDAVEGWREITSYKTIGITSILIMFSIWGFNFFGLSVTHSVSATSRSTIDTSRTLFIWIVSLGLGWETFKWLQVIGFGLLVYGTFLFNGIINPPLRICVVSRVEELLPEEPIEHL
ncbi:MAG: hypothetical protein M1818_004713 [Claussenomyces sp. TS43310]|nr:MAG: hypothetical protein M1818_004713 [Claussenomyces sp. TS43310]